MRFSLCLSSVLYICFFFIEIFFEIFARQGSFSDRGEFYFSFFLNSWKGTLTTIDANLSFARSCSPSRGMRRKERKRGGERKRSNACIRESFSNCPKNETKRSLELHCSNSDSRVRVTRGREGNRPRTFLG